MIVVTHPESPCETILHPNILENALFVTESCLGACIHDTPGPSDKMTM